MLFRRHERPRQRPFAFWPGHVLLGALCILGTLGSCTAADLKRVPARPLPQSTDQRLHALLAAHRGQPVVINFWATWCEPCREEMPSLQRLADRWRERGLVVITVAVANRPKQVEDFLRDNAIRLPAIDDREKLISHAWDVRALPATVILDHHHRMRLRGLGPIDWDAPAIDKKLQALPQ